MISLLQFGAIIRDFLLSIIENIAPLSNGVSSPVGLAYIGETFAVVLLGGICVAVPVIVLYKAIKLIVVRYE